ncbi:MAG: DUF4391 domain-containing protein [Betaproteobacteria bacterium]|nr:DUF4391 domain-containing protein [Betaproteobacteria bacterium]
MSFDLSRLVAALGFPEGATVNQRIPKKMLIETGMPTAADKRAITDGIDDIQWLAALKPVTVGIPAYQDELRDYLEIAVLSLNLRPDAKASRIAELVHRAIPYPTFLMAYSLSGVSISLAHKRWAQNEAGKTVLDGEVLEANLHSPGRSDLVQQFVEALALDKQPHLSLHALYEGWMDTLIALQTAFVTGVFAASASREHAVERHQALQEVKKLRVEIARLKAAAAKEKQIARQVELNTEIKRLEREETQSLRLLRTEKA